MAADDRPVISAVSLNVNERALVGGFTLTGTVNVDYGNDGPGSILPNATVWIDSTQGASLTSLGTHVTLTQTADGYVGTLDGTDPIETWLTFTIDPDTGAFTYNQYFGLDHADGASPTSFRTIQFGFVATDSDGDRTSSHVIVTIEDSRPTAGSDTVTLELPTGVQALDLLANDDGGADGGLQLAGVTVGGVFRAVASTGTTEIAVAHGTLQLAADGTGQFELTDPQTTPSFTEVVGLTLSDADGSLVTTTLDLTVTGRTATGTNGADRLEGSSADDTLSGLGGKDTLIGGLGDDKLDGGAGRDTATFTGAAPVVVDLSQTNAQDTGHGLDTLTGIENVTAGTGNDHLTGNAKGNRLSGGRGDDQLEGGGGRDALLGGAGRDRLEGGAGRDLLKGGRGDDVFVFASGDGVDRITRFDARGKAHDTLDISGLTSVAGWRDLKHHHLVETHSGVVIDAGSGDKIILSGVDLHDLDRGEFIF